MARGFLSGVMAGTLVSAIGLGTVSVLSDGPEPSAPEAAAVDLPAGSEFSRALEDTKAALPQVGNQPESPQAPQVSAPEPDLSAALGSDVTSTAAQPQTGDAEEALTAPDDAGVSSGVTVEGDSPVLPSPQAAAPALPASEDDLSISTDPAQPAPPDPSEEAAFPETDLAIVAEPPVQPAAPDAAPEPETAEPAEATTPEPAPSVSQDVTSEPTPEIAPEPTPEPAGDSAGVPQPEAEATAETSELESSSTIGNLAPDVTTNRLPSVGDTSEPEPEPTPETAEAEPQADLPPLQRHAAEFENPEGKPLMSIILIDDGSSPVGVQALASFPYPLSFAVDAGWDGAADAMAIYRAAGFEVLAMVDLPEGAGAQDAEVAMQAVFGRLPEAVAVIEGTGTGLQSSRAAADQLAPILLDSGHGAVFFPKGLNTAQQILAREGVPSVAVFRDFDAKGQNATVIRRFLDQAAFKAVQEDAGVVMVGRLRPDTISALLLWGLQDRAQRVALAPISALLRGE